MSDLMTGQSRYASGEIDTATTQNNDDPTPISGEASSAKINGLAAAILQIQAILGVGTDLKGSKNDLVERLSIALNANGTIKADTTAAWSGQLIPELGGVPTGTSLEFTGSTLPNGFLWEDGSAVSRTAYPSLNALYAAAGYPYGAGDGLTTFNVRDKRGRFSMGVDGSANRVTSASTGGANADTLGGTGGEQVHTSTLAETPTHGLHADSSTGSIEVASGSGTFVQSPLTFSNLGSGQPHNTMPPWIACNFIVKT